MAKPIFKIEPDHGDASSYRLVSVRGVKGFIPLDTPIRTDMERIKLHGRELDICNKCGATVYRIIDAGKPTEHEEKMAFAVTPPDGPVEPLEVDAKKKGIIREAQIEEAIERAKIRPALINASSSSYGPYAVAKEKKDIVPAPPAQNAGSSQAGVGKSNNDKKPVSESAISPGSTGFRSAGDGERPRAPKNTRPIPPEFQSKKKKEENSENKSAEENSESKSEESSKSEKK